MNNRDGSIEIIYEYHETHKPECVISILESFDEKTRKEFCKKLIDNHFGVDINRSYYEYWVVVVFGWYLEKNTKKFNIGWTRSSPHDMMTFEQFCKEEIRKIEYALDNT